MIGSAFNWRRLFQCKKRPPKICIYFFSLYNRTQFALSKLITHKPSPVSLKLKCKLNFWLVATLNILSAFLVDLLGGGKDDIWIGERGRGLGGGPVVRWWSGRRLRHELQHCTLTPVQWSLRQPHFYQCHFNVWLKFLGSTVLKKLQCKKIVKFGRVHTTVAQNQTMCG